MNAPAWGAVLPSLVGEPHVHTVHVVVGDLRDLFRRLSIGDERLRRCSVGGVARQPFEFRFGAVSPLGLDRRECRMC